MRVSELSKKNEVGIYGPAHMWAGISIVAMHVAARSQPDAAAKEQLAVSVLRRRCDATALHSLPGERIQVRSRFGERGGHKICPGLVKQLRVVIGERERRPASNQNADAGIAARSLLTR